MGLFFEVVAQECGGYEAVCLTEGIRAGGADLRELHANLSHEIDQCFTDRPRPLASQIHLVFSRE
ncbi:MAG: 2-phospho-L-lactate guanylyltransferase [Puniceicoccales bacterium]